MNKPLVAQLLAKTGPLPIYLSPALIEQCRAAGINLPSNFIPLEKLPLTPKPQATTEGVAEAIRKIRSKENDQSE